MFCTSSHILRTTTLLAIFQVTWSLGASIPPLADSVQQPEETVKILNSEKCSFLLETSPQECNNFWAGKQAPVILISLDGFRPEYLTRRALYSNDHDHKLAAPTISCLAQQGISSPYMMPSYPTITFPNHYAIVTGLYPESHEIIGNEFFDPDLNASFSIRNSEGTDPKWWRSGEPIWTTLRKQGKISATYFWPGSDVKFADEEQRSPTYFFKYNKSASFRSRVDQVLDWMDLPFDKRPDLTTLYFEEPDSTGHKAGPNTANVTEKVTIVDSQIRRLIDGLIERNISDCVNIIIVSDHGMADSPSGKMVVDLEKYIPGLQESTLAFYGPVPSIRPKIDTNEEEERIGKALACKDTHMRAFNKWELPYRMHSARSRRIPKIMLDMDVSWRGVFRKDAYSGQGAHGWDNLFLDMQALFVARGPSFKSREIVRPFENVQLYNLMCALVNVAPAENNGTWGALHHLLVDPPIGNVNDSVEFPDMPPILRGLIDSESDMNNRTACGVVNTREHGKIIQEIDINMNMTEEKENELLINHAPLGIPVDLGSRLTDVTLSNSSNHVLLVNEDYVTGFNVELGVPLWTAFTISGGATKNINNDGQWIEDPRLEADHTGSCKRLSNILRKGEVVYNHLFPAEFSTRKNDAWLDTNLLELPSTMSPVIKTMVQMLDEASVSRGPLNVISGPTRHHSPALFYVVTACKVNDTAGEWNLTSCPVKHREIQAFLLPIRHWKYQTCVSERDFIAFNVATLKDVEQVTDLVFFPDLPTEEKLILLARTTLDSALVIDPTRRGS